MTLVGDTVVLAAWRSPEVIQLMRGEGGSAVMLHVNSGGETSN